MVRKLSRAICASDDRRRKRGGPGMKIKCILGIHNWHEAPFSKELYQKANRISKIGQRKTSIGYADYCPAHIISGRDRNKICVDCGTRKYYGDELIKRDIKEMEDNLLAKELW